MQTEQSGWRRMSPARVGVRPVEDAPPKDLYRTARLAGLALNLSSSQRQVLEQLVGCYGGEPLQGRLLVWPSNEFLMDRTGLSERAVRYAISGLIRAGVLSSKDSANGKRFAIRSKQGQIIDAFGLDLTNLLARLEEFEATVERIKMERDQRRRAFDEITVCRRATKEALAALTEHFPQTAVDDLESEFERLSALTPRRDSLAAPESSLTRWRALRDVSEARYNAAYGGKNSRLIEDNNDAPDQSCNKRQRTNDSGEALPAMVELAAACPMAVEYAEEIRDSRDLIREAARLRGVFGTHESAWREACEKLGGVRAAYAFFLVLQLYSEDGGAKIKNFGGYFRNYVRMLDAGTVDLVDELRGMRRRRSH